MFIDTPIYTLDSIMKFGKYKGKTIVTILNEDPSYLVWANENIKSFKLEQGILDEAIDLAFDREMYKHINNIRFDYQDDQY